MVLRLVTFLLVCGGFAFAQEPSAAYTHALAAYRSGRFSAAEAEFRAVIAADAEHRQAHVWLGRAYLQDGQVKAAADLIGAAIGRWPDDPSVQVTYGEVLFRQGAIFEAEKQFVNAANAAAKAGTPDGRAWFGLARVYDAISYRARARMAIQKAHDSAPDDPEIRLSWLFTLHGEERVKALAGYLSGPTPDTDEDRRHLQRALEFMEMRQKAPDRRCSIGDRPNGPTELKLESMMTDPQHYRGFGLVVAINQQKSRLLLDTGASGIVISGKIARKAGIEPVLGIPIAGIGDQGPAKGYVGYADTIQIGSFVFKNCAVEVIEKWNLDSEDGIIGADVFSDFLITMDLPARKFRLEGLPVHPARKVASERLDSDGVGKAQSEPLDRFIAPAMREWAKLYRFGHLLLLPTSIGKSDPKLFLIDTGAFDTILTPEAARVATKVRSDARAQVRGLSGDVKKVYSADSVELRFANLSQWNNDTLTIDLTRLSDHAGTEISGILGFKVLKLLEIKLDYRDGLIAFKYDQAKARFAELR